MSVVINEFEAVADTAPPAPAPSGDASPGGKLKPSDVKRPVATLARRRARVWAH
ncbi:MAG TPA: hypothetical protein VMQ93_01795 [Novosphingobium sp.]|nr:hypothetical protein [Novosphingobium sp.]